LAWYAYVSILLIASETVGELVAARVTRADHAVGTVFRIACGAAAIIIFAYIGYRVSHDERRRQEHKGGERP